MTAWCLPCGAVFETPAELVAHVDAVRGQADHQLNLADLPGSEEED